MITEQFRWRRWLTMAAAVIALAAVFVTAEPRPQGAQAAACGGHHGVTVVVDFTHFGGGITIACAPGDPTTGLAALRTAGFTLTGTKRYGLAFVCRINNLPAPAADACVNTPPAGARWSYWHAPRHGSWTYSGSGAASYNPAPNTVEGWAFGAGTAPGISPP